MSNIYNKSYFNFNNWLLENYKKLNLTNDQLIFLLVLNLKKTSNQLVTVATLATSMGISTKELESIIEGLVKNDLISINASEKGLNISYDKLFKYDPSIYEVDDHQDIYSYVSYVFGKPISQDDLIKMNALINKYGEDKFIKALRVADAYRKYSINYIAGILKNDDDKKKQKNS